MFFFFYPLSFKIFGYTICFVVREVNAVSWMVWCIANMYTAYLLVKYIWKIQNYWFKLTLGTYTNSNMQNSMAMSTLSVFNRKHHFWANLVQNIKIVSLCWCWAPRLIQICRIQQWYSLIPFLTRNTLFGKIWSKNKKLST